MSLCKFCSEEETGGFNNDVYTECAPGDVCGILLAEDLDLVAVNDEVVALNLDVMVEDAVYGVELEHVSEVIRIEEVVDTYNTDVLCEIFNGGAENHTADAAKTVNTKFNHNLLFYSLNRNFL